MPPKRKREPKGLGRGEQLKRTKLAGVDFCNWNWIGAEVVDTSQITPEHRLAACGLESWRPICPNKYAPKLRNSKSKAPKSSVPLDNSEDVVIEDEPPHLCDKTTCRKNPNCLNYLGQEKWENSDAARRAYAKAAGSNNAIGEESRDAGIPVGLVNLGATCYANAYLQVWFRNLSFRTGVYACQNASVLGEDSPIFQLQVTFAALQKLNQRVYNPIKLVESLRLRASEQQDAQEFSKLFMTHLDFEFRKQQHPSLKTLIPSQFQGSQAYGTMCHSCNNRSERLSEFLELEVNLAPDAPLEDLLKQLLANETLMGDNQYYCSQCDKLQDATRYTQLRRLPPVLHISLLRFVFDLSIMERKKSKYFISFPTVLDMSEFLSAGGSSAKNDGSNIYYLRGVLKHKGASAYHGHYTAQVFDSLDKAWYQFDDEIVTKIEGSSDEQITSKSNVYRNNSTEGTNTEKLEGSMASTVPSPERFKSKEAYMLIYERQSLASTTSQSSVDIMAMKDPPPHALDAVIALNNDHNLRLSSAIAREEAIASNSEKIRDGRRNIYRTWHKDTDRDQVVSRQALEKWLSLPAACQKADVTNVGAEGSTTDSLKATCSVDAGDTHKANGAKSALSISDIVCVHGQLNPRRAQDMKRISKKVHEEIIVNTFSEFSPSLTVNDVCPTCTEVMFKERFYDMRHAQQVALFDDHCAIKPNDNHPGHWVSKAWIKDWRLAKPKARTSPYEDVPPDYDDFCEDVMCEHNALSPDAATKSRLISSEAVELLCSFFPNWTISPRGDAMPCVTCQATSTSSKEERRELRKEADFERTQLKHVLENAFDGNTQLLEKEPCALVPAQFLRDWKQWITRPANTPKPTRIDTHIFLCEHGQLIIDPNEDSDLNSQSVMLIRLSDWNILSQRYEAGPLISLTNIPMRENGELAHQPWHHDILVCGECRIRRTDFETAQVTVRIVRDHPIMAALTNMQPIAPSMGTMKSNKRSRQSRRLNGHGGYKKETVLNVTKDMSIKDLKLELENRFGISPILQQLFHRGTEIKDNTSSIASLGIVADDSFELYITTEAIQFANSDDEAPVQDKRQRTEGPAFGGTLLADATDWSSSSSQVDDDWGPRLACPACTFSNDPHSDVCLVCETPIA